MKTTLRRVLWAMLFGVLVYGAFVVVSGFGAISGSLQHFGWWAFGAALGLSSLNYALRFLKWQYYLRVLDIRGVGVRDSLLVFLSGFVLTITPGKVGEVFKSAVLSETHGVAAERTAPIVVAERMTDLIGVVLLILIGSTTLSGGMYWAGLGLLVVAVGLTLILWPLPGDWVLQRLRRGWMARLVPKLEAAFAAVRKLSSPRTLVLPILLSVVSWSLEGLGLYVLLHGFGETVSVGRACFVYATATLAGAITPSPGGLGVTETLIQQQLVHVGGVASAAATSSMLLIRLATLWWAVAVGFVALGFLKLLYPTLLGPRATAAR